MTKREFASLVLKLLGVYAIIEALPLIQYVSMFLGMLGRPNGEWPVGAWPWMATTTPFLLVGGVGVILIARSDSLAGWLVTDDSKMDMRSGLSAQDVQAIAFSVVGVLVLLQAVPRLIHVIAAFSQIASDEKMKSSLLRSACVSLATLLIQVGLGVALFFGSRGLANIWTRLRVAGHDGIGAAEDHAAQP